MFVTSGRPPTHMRWTDAVSHRQKEKEDLEDISNELELADEEDMIPYVSSQPLPRLVALG